MRDSTIDAAMKEAAKIPFQTLRCCRKIMDLILEVAQYGNPKSISDAGVAGEMAHAGAHGAALNIMINLKDIQDKIFCQNMKIKTNILLDETNEIIFSIRKTVTDIIKNG